MANDHHKVIIARGVDVWNAWRAEHPDVLPNLIGADLEGADLQGADLFAANLQKANLIGANLKGANLKWANLKEADLKGADLQGANLTWASLLGSDLEQANFDGAKTAGTRFEERFDEKISQEPKDALTQLSESLDDYRRSELEQRLRNNPENLSREEIENRSLAAVKTHMHNIIESIRLGGWERFRKATTHRTEERGVLRIRLKDEVLASELGKLLNGLADLYSATWAVGRSEPQLAHEGLQAKRISVGTPNVVELFGMISEVTMIAAALLAVLKVPKTLGETAREFAEARKTWVEGTLLQNKLGEDPAITAQQEKQQTESIAQAFSDLFQARDLLIAEPTVLVKKPGNGPGKSEFSKEKEDAANKEASSSA